MDQRDLAWWLSTGREDFGLTQKQLAEKLGVTANTVARWERGELPISKLAHIAAQSVFKSLRGEDQPSPQIDLKRLSQLRRLCHPDKHNNSKASNEATAWLNKMLETASNL
jgi:transcriptional regulator with XRE-family HTH domain